MFSVEAVADQRTERGVERSFSMVWAIRSESNAPLDQLTYGEAPEGWATEREALPLRSGATYSVGPYWFILEARGESVTWTIEEARPIPAPLADP